MRTLAALKWLNRRGAPLAVLALLLATAMFARLMALTRVGVIDGLLPTRTDRAEGRLQFIKHVDAHPWIAVLFAVFFAGSLLWLQFRHSPRWTLWLTFALLALPVFGYLWICFRVGTEPLVWTR